jgi:hypothetical protein
MRVQAQRDRDRHCLSELAAICGTGGESADTRDYWLNKALEEKRLQKEGDHAKRAARLVSMRQQNVELEQQMVDRKRREQAAVDRDAAEHAVRVAEAQASLQEEANAAAERRRLQQKELRVVIDAKTDFQRSKLLQREAVVAGDRQLVADTTKGEVAATRKEKAAKKQTVLALRDNLAADVAEKRDRKQNDASVQRGEEVRLLAHVQGKVADEKHALEVARVERVRQARETQELGRATAAQRESLLREVDEGHDLQVIASDEKFNDRELREAAERRGRNVQVRHDLQHQMQLRSVEEAVARQEDGVFLEKYAVEALLLREDQLAAHEEKLDKQREWRQFLDLQAQSRRVKAGHELPVSITRARTTEPWM